MKHKQKTIPFVNNKGKIIHLPADATIKDLIALGVDKIEIAPKGTPLRKGWWRAD